MKKPTYYLFLLLSLILCSNCQQKIQSVFSSNLVRDIDGNVYSTVKIGNQWWMAENLKVTHYRNGDQIACLTSDYEWDQPTGAYCYYDNDNSNVGKYGLLYNWFTVDDSRSIAPEGWHVPTDTEWQELVDYLGGDTLAGAKMKEVDSDAIGFTALFGGYRYNHGTFDGIGVNAYFWSSTESNSGNAWYRYLYHANSIVYRDDSGWKQAGYSVRCVKD